MIVITHEEDVDFVVNPGDTFSLMYTDKNNQQVKAVTAECTGPFTPKKAIIFVFTDEGGSCYNKNVCGMFCDELPYELKCAVNIKDLTPYQMYNFHLTSPIKTEIV